jgi:hypothetical protein
MTDAELILLAQAAIDDEISWPKNEWYAEVDEDVLLVGFTSVDDYGEPVTVELDEWYSESLGQRIARAMTREPELARQVQRLLVERDAAIAARDEAARLREKCMECGESDAPSCRLCASRWEDGYEG